MNKINFRPLRVVKKTGKITVASYTQWNKLRCANYNSFSLNVIDEYSNMSGRDYVYDGKGELLYHFAYNPWEVYEHHGSCIARGFSWDEMRETYKDFALVDSFDGRPHKTHFMRGADSSGTPIFTHLTADKIVDSGYVNLNDFEPLTVSKVVEWLGWFLYQLENSTLKVV